MKATIQSKRFLSEKFCMLTLTGDERIYSAYPGQFVMVKVSESFDPFLRRPLGIMEVSGDTFTLLFEITGRGTKILAQRNLGEELDVLGPLGKGFSLSPSFGILVAGGRGIVPLYFLASTFTRTGVPFVFLLGIRDKEELFLLDFLKKFSPVFWSCEEEVPGGFCGDVVTLLERHLTSVSLPDGTRVYSCGPEGMVRALCKAEGLRNIPVEVSLESLMGCGFGVCLSCGVEKMDGEGYYHICKDGPVFLLSEVRL
ncbi:MAG: dihydroorotate dehydrogenase electron transfer subunit [Atribacterota bacterium]